MVNKNKYELYMKHTLVIKVTKPDDTFKSYALMEDQLVSILYLDTTLGLCVVRGRIKGFEYPTLTRTVDCDWASSSTSDQDTKNISVKWIVLDISKNYQQQEKKIDPKSILEVNSIDWEYQNTDKVIVDAPINDWHEKDNKVSAPSSEHQYRYGLNINIGDVLK